MSFPNCNQYIMHSANILFSRITIAEKILKVYRKIELLFFWFTLSQFSIR